MHYWEANGDSPAANLAADEALLEACEQGGNEVLRFWEPKQYFVVLGYSNAAAREANLENCRRDGVAVLRRCSGGGTVLQGRGCLNYSLIMRMDRHEALASIPGANCHIMNRQRDAIQSVARADVSVEGITDLCLKGLKFSGNAQRRMRQALIFHGAFLLDFDLELVEKYLATPSRQPIYRRGRSHRDFITNLNVSAESVKQALREAWEAQEPLPKGPDYQRLAVEKYASDAWNFAR